MEILDEIIDLLRVAIIPLGHSSSVWQHHAA